MSKLISGLELASTLSPNDQVPVNQGNPPTTRRAPVSMFGIGLILNIQTGTSYTLVISDGVQTLVRMNNASAMTLTIPPYASVPFPVGTNILVDRMGAGTLTISPGSGVTLQGPSFTARVQYSTLGLICVATNTWLVCGDYT